MPKPTVASLHKRLQVEVNRYVRLRDTWYEDGIRVGDCISCGIRLPYEKLQAGHFVPANHYIYRYNTLNINSQCVVCNKYKHGNPLGYWLALNRKHGPELPYYLAWSANDKVEWTYDGLLELISYYKIAQGRVL